MVINGSGGDGRHKRHNNAWFELHIEMSEEFSIDIMTLFTFQWLNIRTTCISP